MRKVGRCNMSYDSIDLSTNRTIRSAPNGWDIAFRLSHKLETKNGDYGLEAIDWFLMGGTGPGELKTDDILRRLSISKEDLEASLQRLLDKGWIEIE
jgi:hypothetical protein